MSRGVGWAWEKIYEFLDSGLGILDCGRRHMSDCRRRNVQERQRRISLLRPVLRPICNGVGRSFWSARPHRYRQRSGYFAALKRRQLWQKLVNIKTRLTLDLTDNEFQRVKDLEELYDETSQAAAVRVAIRHDLYFAKRVKAGGKIQVLNPDGTVEIIVFPEWMFLQC